MRIYYFLLCSKNYWQASGNEESRSEKNETLNPCVFEAETLLFVMHEKAPPAPTPIRQKASE